MDSLTMKFKRINVNVPQRVAVDEVYHATAKDEHDGLTHTEQLDTLVWQADGKDMYHPCTLFSCNLYRDERPTISPYDSNHVVIPVTDVLESEDDFLIPIHPYPTTALPNENYRSPGGGTYFEMVYIRRSDILDAGLELDDTTRRTLQQWQLKTHPFIRLANQRLEYVHRQHLWWMILTPLKVPIPSDAIWEHVTFVERDVRRERGVNNPVVLSLMRILPLFNKETKKVNV